MLAEVALNPTAKLFVKLAKNQFTLAADDIDEEIQDERIVFLEKALELDPENVKILKDLASSYGEEDVEKTIRLYTKLIELSKKPEKFYFDFARAYECKDDYETALGYYVDFLIKKPNKYTELTQEEIINACEILEKDPIKVLEGSLKYGKNPNTVKALYRLYFNQKNYNKASTCVLQYIEETDLQTHDYSSISERFLKKDAYREVLPILEKILSKQSWDNEKMRTYNSIGLCYLRLKPQDIDSALVAFHNGYKLDTALQKPSLFKVQKDMILLERMVFSILGIIIKMEKQWFLYRSKFIKELLTRVEQTF